MVGVKGQPPEGSSSPPPGVNLTLSRMTQTSASPARGGASVRLGPVVQIALGNGLRGWGQHGTLPSPPGDQDPDSPCSSCSQCFALLSWKVQSSLVVSICGAHALVSLRPMAKRHTQTTAQTSPLRRLQGHVQAPPLLPHPAGLTSQDLSFPLFVNGHMENAWFEFPCEKCNTMPGTEQVL